MALFALLSSGQARAAPVSVRFNEGLAHGFLTLRAEDGKKLADGDYLQETRGHDVETRLAFRFADGSLFEETALFSQHRVFRLLWFRRIQRGPSFPATQDVSFDGRTGEYTGRYRERADGQDQALEGRIDVPPDVYNGMLTVLLKNLPTGAVETVHVLAFTPKPELVTLRVAPPAEEKIRVGDRWVGATHYVVTTEVEGFRGVIAALLGKKLPVLHYWILRGHFPAFLTFEGPFFLGGPTWRVASSLDTDRPKASGLKVAGRSAPPR